MVVHEIAMAVLGILCGSLLFGSFLPKKLKGIDVAAVSDDHNPGTANAMKHAGIPVGILCLIGDIFKGTIPVNLSIRMGLETGSLFPLIMAAPVFGHAYSLFHKGKGGKAIAVSFGVLIGLLPLHTELLLLLCVLYIFFSTVVVIRPHARRTRVTFCLFALGSMVLACVGVVPGRVCLGALLIACIVVSRNRVGQQDWQVGAGASLGRVPRN